jgi:pyruvate phosphate dikinase-like enzyme
MTKKKSSGQLQDGRKSKRSSSPSKRAFTLIGTGEIGGKAQGLEWAYNVLRDRVDQKAYPEFTIDIPWFWVIASDWFDQFMEQNSLYDIALSDTRDPHMANAFQKAELPAELVEELKDLIAGVQLPLAVRSSSSMEDALKQPFAGVYATKMVPNNQFSPEARLRTLLESIKFVYASTFTQDAKSYRQAMGRAHTDEKMAVIIQEVVGQRHGDRFYPNVSGVARSYNFYAMGHAQPENGVVSLALGLGKTIVDGGRSWTFCPAYPKAKPPFGSTKEFLNQTQTQFWSVNMGKSPTYDPIHETEYLFEGNLEHAEEDRVLREVASTYDPQSDRITMGVGFPGPRVLDFAPLLELNNIPLNDVVQDLLTLCEEELGNPVEIEFAVNFSQDGSGHARFGFLQVRPMFVSKDVVKVSEQELAGDHVVLASEEVLGNGLVESIQDIVYVKPENFSAKDTWLIASELDEMNRRLLDAHRPYLLVVIGRLGTADPWLGIPVKWGQVSGAKVVVETSTSAMNVDMSQGSHFFHNLTCLRILYFSADKTGQYPVNWKWIENQKGVHESQYVRHVVLAEPLHIKVDGTNCRGVIAHERAN